MTKEQQQKIEKYFADSMKQLEIKPGTKTFKKYEAMFFIGARKVLEVINEKVPPIWSICQMSGRSIIEEYEKQKADSKN